MADPPEAPRVRSDTLLRLGRPLRTTERAVYGTLTPASALANECTQGRPDPSHRDPRRSNLLPRIREDAAASGFRHSEAALTHHRFACANGTETGWLLVRFNPPLARAPEATLDDRKPLTTWLTTKEGVQWVNIAGPAPRAEQPSLFAWQSGVELYLKLPAPARVDDWVLHRASEKPDSASAVVQRRLLIGAMTVLVVLSFVATFVAQKIFETPEDLDTKKYVRMLIEACDIGSRAETEQAHRLLRAVVLDGQSLEAAMASLDGDPKNRRLLAIRAVGRLKAKLLTFHEELSVFKSRLERAR